MIIQWSLIRRHGLNCSICTDYFYNVFYELFVVWNFWFCTFNRWKKWWEYFTNIFIYGPKIYASFISLEKRGWIIDYRIFIFGSIIPLRKCLILYLKHCTRWHLIYAMNYSKTYKNGQLHIVKKVCMGGTLPFTWFSWSVWLPTQLITTLPWKGFCPLPVFFVFLHICHT